MSRQIEEKDLLIFRAARGSGKTTMITRKICEALGLDYDEIAKEALKNLYGDKILEEPDERTDY